MKQEIPTKMLVSRALLLLAFYDILSCLGSFRIVHAIVRRWKVTDRAMAGTATDSVVKAVNYACVWYPKQAQCLQRSFVMTYLLRRSGIPAEMVLGASTMPFRAHAWVEVEGCPVNERSGTKERYAVWERC
jgi:hypothetical protein